MRSAPVVGRTPDAAGWDEGGQRPRPRRPSRLRAEVVAGAATSALTVGLLDVQRPFADGPVPTSRGAPPTVLRSRRIVCGRGIATATDSPLDPGGFMVLSFRRFVGRVAVGALAVAVPVVMTPLVASADAPTDLFFSEYIEGSSSNKALEIYNGTGAAVDLAGGGYRCSCTPTGHHREQLDGAVRRPGQRRCVRRGARRRERNHPGRGGRKNSATSAATATTPWCCAKVERQATSSTSSARSAPTPARVGIGSDQHRRQHPAPQGDDHRRRHQRDRRLRPGRRVGRVRGGHLRRPRSTPGARHPADAAPRSPR